MTRLTQASKTKPSTLQTRSQNMASRGSGIRQSSPASSSLSSIRRSEAGKKRSEAGKKRSAADAELFEVPGAKNIRIQENLDKVNFFFCMVIQNLADLDKDLSSTEEDSDSDILEVKKPLPIGPKSRSFSTIPSELQTICQRAQRYVSEYTLFTNPFLSSVDILHLLVDSWNAGQDAEQSWHERTKDCDSIVCLFPNIFRRIADFI